MNQDYLPEQDPAENMEEKILEEEFESATESEDCGELDYSDDSAGETENAQDFGPVEVLRENTKEALFVGAAFGLAIGLLMFFVPSSAMEEGARLTISVILILLGPRLMQDKFKLDFTKGRYAMAGALVLTLIVYILMGHPVD